MLRRSQEIQCRRGMNNLIIPTIGTLYCRIENLCVDIKSRNTIIPYFQRFSGVAFNLLTYAFNMPGKFKRNFFEIIFILIVVIVSAFISNELRADKLPLLPYYVTNNFYHEMRLNDFHQHEGNDFKGLIFDARPHSMYEKGHVTAAKNFSVSEFDFFYHFHLANVSPDTPIFIYGRTVSNAYDLELAYRLHIKGHKNITVLF